MEAKADGGRGGNRGSRLTERFIGKARRQRKRAGHQIVLRVLRAGTGGVAVERTEKDKMLAGELYSPGTDGLLASERASCKGLCHRHNLMDPGDLNGREGILREILGSAGESFLVEQPFWCDYGWNIALGERFYSNHGLVVLDCAPVSFGQDVMVGPNCGFYTAAHPLDPALRVSGIEYALPIRVGDGVWIGGGVTVLPGVTIGDWAVIGAGSVVTRDVPPRTVAAGNPCRALGPAEGRDGKP
jgi:acetyltransferase-like isoleucine patch superfamily enzyme